MSATNVSATEQVEVLPHIPSGVVEKILEYVTSNDDRMNCRMVCKNWMYIIDVFLGMELKLNAMNKEKLFQSELIRSCTSLNIYESAGDTMFWGVCPFSPLNLKYVEILGNILCHNWRLLLNQCKGIEFLTVTAHACRSPIFDFNDNTPGERVDHYRLRRLDISDISSHDNAQEIKDYTSTSHLMNTLGNIPRLSQVIIVFRTYKLEYNPNDFLLINALKTLMERNPNLHSIGLMERFSSFRYASFWENFLEDNNKGSCLVHTRGVYQEWSDIFDRLRNVHTLVYSLLSEEHFSGFMTLIQRIGWQSQNLRKLFLVLSSFDLDSVTVFDCAMLLEGFKNIVELTLCRYHQYGAFIPSPNLLNLNAAVLNNNIPIQYLYISIELSEENLHAIFDLLKLTELHIALQDSAEKFNEQHFIKAMNHPQLKLIFWQKYFQNKWEKFNQVALNENWDSVKMNHEAVIQYRWDAQSPTYILLSEEGCIEPTLWKDKYSETWALFHKDRIDDSDRLKIKSEYQRK